MLLDVGITRSEFSLHTLDWLATDLRGSRQAGVYRKLNFPRPGILQRIFWRRYLHRGGKSRHYLLRYT